LRKQTVAITALLNNYDFMRFFKITLKPSDKVLTTGHSTLCPSYILGYQYYFFYNVCFEYGCFIFFGTTENSVMVCMEVFKKTSLFVIGVLRR